MQSKCKSHPKNSYYSLFASRMYSVYVDMCVDYSEYSLYELLLSLPKNTMTLRQVCLCQLLIIGNIALLLIILQESVADYFLFAAPHSNVYFSYVNHLRLTFFITLLIRNLEAHFPLL